MGMGTGTVCRCCVSASGEAAMESSVHLFRQLYRMGGITVVVIADLWWLIYLLVHGKKGKNFLKLE